MFERFTDRSRRVIVISQEQSRDMRHTVIGTEHVLLGILQEDESLAAQVLKDLGVTLERAQKIVLEVTGGEGKVPPAAHIPFTPRTKKVLELGLREALQLGHNYVAPEHILLALIREGEGRGAEVLRKFGFELSHVRQRTVGAITGSLSSVTVPLRAAAKRATRWPYTTPSGHTYREPDSYAELQQRANDAAQAWIEAWPPDEHPPEPTWAMVGIAQAEVLRLRVALSQARDQIAERDRTMRADDAALDQEISTRDRYHDLLDRFAYAVAPQSEIGEHTSMNDPWANALEILENRSR